MCRRRGDRPRAGDWEEAAGGGAVAAVQLANLNGSAQLFTSLGNDELGRRAREELAARGVTVHAAAAGEPQRRAYTYVDENGERTITVLGRKQRAVRRGRVAAVGGARALRRRLLRQRRRRRAAGARDARPCSSRRRASSRRCSAPRGDRRARRQRRGPGGALRARRARAAAAHRRHDVGRARRLDPPGRPVPRRAAAGADPGRVRLRRLLRRRADVRARRRARARRSGRARRALRRRGPVRPRRVRRSARRGGASGPPTRFDHIS